MIGLGRFLIFLSSCFETRISGDSARSHTHAHRVSLPSHLVCLLLQGSCLRSLSGTSLLLSSGSSRLFRGCPFRSLGCFFRSCGCLLLLQLSRCDGSRFLSRCDGTQPLRWQPRGFGRSMRKSDTRSTRMRVVVWASKLRGVFAHRERNVCPRSIARMHNPSSTGHRGQNRNWARNMPTCVYLGRNAACEIFRAALLL